MEHIKQMRAKRGMTQTALAGAAGMDPATLNRIEQGKANPNLKTLERLADALGITVSRLLEDDSPEARPQPPLEHVLREMQRLYAPGRVLDWSRADLERIADRTDEVTRAQFAQEFEVGNDSLAQEIAQTGAAVCALLRARAQRAPTQSTKTARAAAQAVEQKLAGMAPTAA